MMGVAGGALSAVFCAMDLLIAAVLIARVSDLTRMGLCLVAVLPFVRQLAGWPGLQVSVESTWTPGS